MNQIITLGIKAALSAVLLFSSAGMRAGDFAIVNLSPEEISIAALNTTYTSGTSSVQITTGNMSFDADYSTNCVDFVNQKGALYFNQLTAPSYSFITIDNTGTDNITSIKLIGSSTEGTAGVFVAFSGKSVAETTDLAYSENLDFANATVPFYTPVEGGGCQEKTVTLPDANNTTSMEAITFVKSIKIAVSTAFGQEEYSLQKPFKLESMAVYTDKQPNTGIGTVSDDSFTACVWGEELHFTETASSVFVYDVSGRRVRVWKNIQTLSLRDLPSGMYVIKALNDNGKRTVIKTAR